MRFGVNRVPRSAVDLRRDRERAAPTDPDFAPKLAAEAGVLARFARRLCGRPDAADDLVQDTMRRALERRASYDAARPIRAWLLRVAYRLWLDAAARAAKRSADEADVASGPLVWLMRRRSGRTLERIGDAAPPEPRGH